MDSISYKTTFANKATAQKDWVIVDAEGKTLGRFASQVAMILRGKNKPSYTPHADCGDNVIIINCEKIRLTGNKMNDKVYTTHTGHPGGQRFQTPKEALAKYPERVLERAIRGMLPKNRIGRELFRHVHVYEGVQHPHEAQQPKVIQL
jgi:large subunit ribosomal protein L13